MAAPVEFFNPALWREWLSAEVGQLGYATFWLAVGQIIFINALLSGDNAILIAMACRGLPPPQRRWGLIIGAGLAALLRIVFTAVLASLMMLPYLKLIGGALLFVGARAGLYWIAGGDILCIIAVVLSAWVLMIEILR